jgi:hypothetical protein
VTAARLIEVGLFGKKFIFLFQFLMNSLFFLFLLLELTYYEIVYESSLRSPLDPIPLSFKSWDEYFREFRFLSLVHESNQDGIIEVLIHFLKSLPNFSQKFQVIVCMNLNFCSYV